MKIVQKLSRQGRGIVECPYCGERFEGCLSGHLKNKCEKVKNKITTLPKDGGGNDLRFNRFMGNGGT